HGTVVNRLSYQTQPFGPQIQTDAFEIITGPVAIDKPFGPTIVDLAFSLGLISPQLRAFYLAAPPDVKEQIIAGIINPGLASLGYNQLDPKKDPLPNMHLLAGNYLATDSYGWSEFTIDPQTQQLRITTYGITPYTQDQLEADPDAIIAQTPQIVS